MENDIVKVAIPYQNMVWGEVIIRCKKDSNVSNEAFIEGIQKGAINPWDCSVGDEEWVDYDSDDPHMTYQEAEESK